MTIYFDMDGTLADLYGVENWLSYLKSFDPFPYIAAKPLIHLPTLARYLHQLQAAGWKIGIISWLSKTNNKAYDETVTKAKLEWLSKHLPSVSWDEIQIVSYGTSKSKVAKDKGFLFDDEFPNLKDWLNNEKGQAYFPDNILNILRLLKNC